MKSFEKITVDFELTVFYFGFIFLIDFIYFISLILGDFSFDENFDFKANKEL